MWIYVIKIVTWFLILVSDTMTIDFGSANNRRVISLSLHIYTLIFSLLFVFVEWKEKQLGKISIGLSPRENSLLKRSKNRKTLLVLLFISTIEPLIFNCCLEVSLSNDIWWTLLSFVCLNSKSDLIIWFDGRICALSWDLLLSFCKWRWIRIRLAIILILNKRNVQKAPNIYIAALLCIFLSSLGGYNNSVLL